MNLKRICVIIIIIASLVLSGTAMVQAQSFPPGLISYWNFDDLAGTTAIDSISGNNGQLRNDPVWTTGIVGGALSLDGNDFVDCGTANNLNLGTGPFTIELWVNYRTLSGEQILIEKYIETYNSSSCTGWCITKLSDNSFGFGGFDRPIIPLVAPPIAINNWYHVAVTRNGNIFTFYWNGNPISSATEPTNLNLDTTSSLKIGHRGNPSDTPGSQDTRGFYMNGLVDEVAIYNIALTPQEIIGHYQNGLQGLGYFASAMAVTAVDDTVTTNKNTPITIPVLANDTDLDGDPLIITDVSYPNNGSAIKNLDNTITYSPNLNFTGTDSFTYTASDGKGGTDTAIVTVNVYSVGDVGGPITVNTIWHKVDSPFTIHQDVTVLSGVTLTIEPGVTVKFDAGKSLNINGKLVAIGTESEKIIFTSNGSLTPGFWKSISLSDTSVDATFDGNGNYINGCILQYTDIQYGGSPAISVNASSPFIANSIITNNLGRGISITNGSPVISYCEISNHNDSGIYYTSNAGNNLTIKNCTITNNTTSNYGGGVYAEGGIITIESSTISNNIANNRGGGVYAIGYPFTIRDSTISGNHTLEDGGGVFSGGNSTVQNCIFNRNSTTGDISDDGGGLCNLYMSNITAEGNTFTANYACGGGAFVAGGGITILRDNVFKREVDSDSNTGNSSSGIGGAIIAYGTVTMQRNVITGNKAGLFQYGSVVDIQYNVSSSSVIGGSSANANTITGNTGDAIRVNGNPVFSYNNIYNNTGYEFICDNSSGSSPLNIGYCYWGTADENGVRSEILDNIDDSNRGLVNYIPFLTVPVGQGNNPPFAANDTAATNEYTPVIINVLTNDFDPDGDPMNITAVSDPPNGSAIINGDSTITYTPDLGFVGSDSFTYTIIDGNGGTATAIVSIRMTNNPPVAIDDIATTDENQGIDIPVLDNDSDLDGDPLTITEISNPTKGDAINNGNSITYNPYPDVNGSDSFTYTISDGNGGTATAHVNITINIVNNPPFAENDSATTDSNIPVIIPVLDNDYDPDDDPLIVTDIPSPPSMGSAIINDDYTITYTPAPGANGSDSFTYVISDSNGETAEANVEVNINYVNTPPIAVDDMATGYEGIPIIINILSNDSDPDGDYFDIDQVSDPSMGTVNNNGRSITYTPNPGFIGPDSFTYTIVDDYSETAMATVNVTIQEYIPSPPRLISYWKLDDLNGETASDQISHNDGQLRNGPVWAGGIVNGALSLDGLDDFVDCGTSSDLNLGVGPFTFELWVNFRTLDGEQVLIEKFIETMSEIRTGWCLTKLNDNSLAFGGSGTTDAFIPIVNPSIETDQWYHVALTRNGYTFTLYWNGIPISSGDRAVNLDTTSSLKIGHRGDPLDTPGSIDTRGFYLNGLVDEVAIHNKALTTEEIAQHYQNGLNGLGYFASVSHPPVASNQSVSTDEDIALSITLTGSDVDEDILTYIIVTQPSQGILSGTSPNLMYTPNTNYNGSDSFTFKMNDGTVDSNIATVSITINAMNDSPVAVNDIYNTDEDTALTIVVPGVLSNDTDIEGNTLTSVKMSDPSYGILTLNADGSFTYTPAIDYNGIDSFTYKANDGVADSNIATASITINGVNDAPLASNQSVSTDEDIALSIILTGSDVDEDTLTYIIVTQPSQGTLSGTSPNLTYTPNANYNGSDSFRYKVNDGTIDSNIATVSITINGVNDAPLASNQSVIIDEDIALTITLTGSDVDEDTLTYIIVTQPSQGTLSGTGPNMTYIPNANYNGSDSFTYKVNDGTVDSNIATVSITINAVNDAPIVNAGADITINEGDTFISTGLFTDSETGTWTATVDYGDGSGKPLTLNDKTFSLSHLYADNGIFTVTITVNDDGEIVTDTVIVTVNNVIPVVNADYDAVTGINEGCPFTGFNSGLFTDPGADTWVATINYGDGSEVQPLTVNPSKTFIWDHVYLDSGTYTVTISVTDKDGAVGSDTTLVTVYNVAPTVEIPGSNKVIAINEGENFTITGSFTDPGADTWTATVDYGYGDIQPLTLVNKNFTLNYIYPAGMGDYSVMVRVIDKDGGVGGTSILVAVIDPHPIVEIDPSLPTSMPEGSPFLILGSFTDYGTGPWTAMVNYGDSPEGSDDQSLTLNSDKTFQLFHIYADSGNYTIGVGVVDAGQNRGNTTVFVTITNVSPTVTASLNAIMEGSDTFVGTGSFEDPGVETWTATVNYGDGPGSEQLTLNPDKTFNLGHIYTNNGTYTVTISVADDDGGTGNCSFQVEVNITSGVNVELGDEILSGGGTIESTQTGNIDPGQQSPEEYTYNNDQVQDLTFGLSWPGSSLVLSVYDPSGNLRTQTDQNAQPPLTVTIQNAEIGNWRYTVTPIDVPHPNYPYVTIVGVLNQPPVIEAGGPYSVEEGSSVTVNAIGNDPDGDSMTFEWDLNSDGTYEIQGQSVSFSATDLDGPNSYNISVRATDSHGVSATDQAIVNVSNAQPIIDTIAATLEPTVVDTAIDINASFSDKGKLDTHTATWNWDDGNTSAGAVIETNGTGSVTGSHTYAMAGVYTVILTVKDDDNSEGQSSFEYVVIYDPSAGFVTGGGWITSPVGAYFSNPTLTGKANFGFVSKYQKGANIPTGNTEFNFKIANMNFRSTTYEWLVIAGEKAKYKGFGTINGSGDYQFMLSAIDGQVNGGGGVDRFRIKIWDKASGGVVYDNQKGDADDADATDAIEGGSIVIHKDNKPAAPESVPLDTCLLASYPNPANPEVWIPYRINLDSDVVIRIYDSVGRLVRTLDLGSKSAGFYVSKEKSAYWDGNNESGEKVASGIYFYNIKAGDYFATKKLVIAK